jgi:hypothetical protein
MKSTIFILTLFLLNLSLREPSPDMQSLERIIDASPLVHSTCDARVCIVAPVDGNRASQEYRDELQFLRSHLNGMGVELKEEDGLSRQGQAQSI